ncbi:phospho-N-acetylmuramoyl-pentapeptide-transferase [Patescibacteria group bacterium]|nr:phospho-N-acetylmuramoyl-pentapeptide-transferase [Patescibacteria group bacterium]MBU1123383.1 phospho-N-acetylmuramoyl-pentapeptide-transferase [Patescibacteria group bacterium]
MPLPIIPFRPEIPLIAILGYTFFAFVAGLTLTTPFLLFLKRNRLGKQLRVETIDGRTPSVFRKYHQDKWGTPTMGGILIWTSILLTVFFSRILSFFGAVEHSLLQRGQVYLPLFTLLTLGALGAVDDYINILGSGKRGLSWLPKLLFLIIIGLCGLYWFYFKLGYNQIHVPFYGSYEVGLWYVPIFLFILIGTANAVNVTDGLDGLAGGLLVIAFGSFAVLSFLAELYVLAAFCGVCVGAVAAFLWHNVPPALFFMGDTGSLALGGTLGVIALMTDNVLILPFVGFIFVIEMLSVIIQLTSKKFRGGKKVFKAAPIHHHFEALDWGESKVTMRLWIVGMFMAFLGIIIGIVG